MRCREAYLHPQHILEQFPCLFKRHPVASRTSVSSPRGVGPPPSSPNCNPGGNEPPTDRAGLHTCASVSRLPLPSFAGSASALHAPAACHMCAHVGRSASGSFLQSCVFAILYHVLEQLGRQLVDLFIHCRFDLGPCRLWVLLPPFRQPNTSCSQALTGLRVSDSAPIYLSWPSCSCLSPHLFSPYFTTSLLCAKKTLLAKGLESKSRKARDTGSIKWNTRSEMPTGE